MRIILLGAPGTGKGTQGKFIENKYNIPQISTGDILREKIYSQSKIGKIIKNTIEEGKLISDNIVCQLIIERINQKDCVNGFLLDGFPRTKEQAYFMVKKKIKINYVIELKVSFKSILERLSGRRIHVESGRIYHIKFNPPKISEKDDITGQSLITRKDDKKEIIKKRLEEYSKITYPLIEYYLNEEKLNHLKYFRINAEKSLSIIQKKIELILNQKNDFL